MMDERLCSETPAYTAGISAGEESKRTPDSQDTLGDGTDRSECASDAKQPENTRDQQPRTKEAATMSETNERSVASTGSVEPVAWAVMSGGDIVYDIYDIEGEAVAICLWLRDEEDDGSWVTVPLYPKQPQLTLTDSERKALETAVRMAGDPSPITAPQVFEYAATLRGLLERTK